MKFKRPLVLVLVLALAMSAVTGGTIAWFTDEVTSARNTIESGNLDMKLSYKPYGTTNTEWTEVTNETVLFGEDALYEPGYTEAVWLKVENAGNLAFRYQFDLNVLSETLGKTKDGADIKLSEHLDVLATPVQDYLDYETRYPNRDGLAYTSLKEEGDLATGSVRFANNYVMLPETDPYYVLTVITMPTTVGNEANHNGTDIPKIEFGLTARATQVPYESDSFGSDYDADSDYLNPASMGYEVAYIYDLDDFAEFGKDVNNNTTYGGINVANNPKVWIEVMADIDMTDAPAIQGTEFAIGNGNNNKFQGVFDGNNHVISNYTIEAEWSYYVALFRTVSDGFTMRDITFEDCSAAKTNNRYGTLLVGGVGGGTVTFDNVDIKDSTISGVSGASAYSGVMTEGALYFKNCDTTNVTLKASSEDAPYVAMYLANGWSHHDYEESGIWVTNCTMNECSATINGVAQETIKEHNYIK